jgi:urea transport system permease protein
MAFQFPPPEPILPRYGWWLTAGLSLLALVVVPLCALWIPAGHPLHISAFGITLFGKILCYGLAALALGLVWGYAGVLSLGHGLFFALGGYAMGMYLMRQIGTDGVYQTDLPDFMVFLNWTELPWFWAGSNSIVWAIAMMILLPGSVAFVFGYLAFRSRVKGVYLSIITQALTFAAMLLFFRNETGFGGNNGFTDFKRILGFPIAAPEVRVTLFVLSFIALLGAFLVCRVLMRGKFGKVMAAIRDAEGRAMFLGFNPVPYKLAVWTFSAVLCGIAGGLYVPQVGIINPSEMAPMQSIEMAVWVAIGGRGTLIGPILGAFSVNGAKTLFTTALPEYWLFLLGALFILTTLFLPKGLIGIAKIPWTRRGVR